ncbi:hypothetical protein AAG906_015710 [Vitis piasezkii]
MVSKHESSSMEVNIDPTIANPNPWSSTRFVPISFNHSLSVKLDSKNFLIWKQWIKFVHSDNEVPVQFLTREYVRPRKATKEFLDQGKAFKTQLQHAKKGEEHWKVVKRILRYLQGTLQHGLHLKKSSNLDLVGFCDVDWAYDLDDRRATSRHCVFLQPNLISWQSKNELQIPLAKPPLVWCDNLSTVLLSVNPILHARTKHIELDLYFVRERAILLEGSSILKHYIFGKKTRSPKLKPTYSLVSSTIFTRIMNLKPKYASTQLDREFEMLEIKKIETIKDYSTSWLLMNELCKNSCNSPKKYESKISSLEESKDLSSISLAELVNALQAQEQMRMIRKKIDEGCSSSK